MKIVVYYRYALVALCAIIIFLLYWKVFSDEIARETAKELFVAMVAAIVTSFLLESASRQELKETVSQQIQSDLTPLNVSVSKIQMLASEIKNDVTVIEHQIFKRVYRKHIPRAVFEQVEERILGGDFYRTNHQAIWTLKLDRNSNPSRIRATVDTKFTLHNLTDSSQKFIPRFAIDERSTGDETAKILSIAINGKNGEVAKFVKKHDQNEDESWYEYEEQIVPADGRLDLSNRFEFLRYMNDHEMWTTLYPSDGMKVRFYLPVECIREHFKVETIGNLEHSIERGETYIDVDVPKVVLPHQGLLFYWRFVPKESPIGDL